MGFYLNIRAAYTLYQSEAGQPYFVDKTKMLGELFPFVKTGNRHICLTRPRRFGKTMIANMIASFFTKACDTKLRGLLKYRPYVQFAYMTGILPISKYSSGSELNMFAEYTMAKSRMFSEYFGFSDSEVDMLYVRYCENQEEPHYVEREELRRWYDGYAAPSGNRIYNPRSVVLALVNNNLDNYWTSSGPYDEIFCYIRNNVDSVRDDLVLMVSGTSGPLKLQLYAATSQNLKTKEEILSAMVVYGFLSYENGAVSIPNKELMDKFADMMMRKASLGYVYQLAKESERMLKATLAGDTDTMEEILELVHDTVTPILAKNTDVRWKSQC